MQHPSSFRLVLSTLALAAFAAAQSPITPGNLIVSRVGDGSLALSNAAAPRFLDEYTPAGVLVQTIALPTTASGANQILTGSGSATSEGFIAQSSDARYLFAVGYAAAPGTAAVTTTVAGTNPRVVARIALDGTVDTSTALGDCYSNGNIRSVCSTDGCVRKSSRRLFCDLTSCRISSSSSSSSSVYSSLSSIVSIADTV